MEKSLKKLDKLNTKISKVAFNTDGTLKVDKRLLDLFDVILLELIETKRILDFANQRKPSKWEHILGILKEMVTSKE